GLAAAEDNLGYMYLFGKGGVSKDYQKALYWIKKAAHQGDALGEATLGHMYAEGLGVPQDYSKALYWFKKAAKQGLAQAENNLGYMYAEGLGVPQDYNEAVYWLQKAAEQGLAQAKINLEYIKTKLALMHLFGGY
ncbi:tetratricopeptide repeat protein, partial [Hydrogenobaculum sp.]|nr:hypothetical protein [Hydrogenobaculum sp.]